MRDEDFGFEAVFLVEAADFAVFAEARRVVDLVAAVFFFAMGALSPQRVRLESAYQSASDKPDTGLNNDPATVYCAGCERPQSSQPAPKSKPDVVQTPISSVKEPQVPVRYEDAEFCRIQLHLNESIDSELDNHHLGDVRKPWSLGMNMSSVTNSDREAGPDVEEPGNSPTGTDRDWVRIDRQLPLVIQRFSP